MEKKSQGNQKEQPRPSLGQRVIRSRYLFKNSQGKVIETPTQLYQRVAQHVASAEHNYGWDDGRVAALAQQFEEMMNQRLFLPNSPTLMNAGRPDGMLSACFVLSIEDSIEAIFETVKNTALIQKKGGGTGFSLDKLRPTGDRVGSTGGKTSGPISFWRVICETTNAIQQGAFRRGANMAMMSTTHPDILKFLDAKQDPDAFTNFNISVKITDEWMRQLDAHPDAPLTVTNPRNGQRFYLPRSLDIRQYEIGDLVPVPSESGSTVDFPEEGDFWTHQQIWDLIVANARETGEPGVCFIDRVNQDNPTPVLGPIGATNPCGEQPLLDYEACNLGSINLAKFVLTDGSDLDWDKLARIVELGIRFLDDVIDVSCWPNEKVEQRTRMNRKIGLGIMGFAHSLVLLGIRYDSESAIEFARRVGRFIQEHAHQASEKLAGEKGTFLNWQGSIWDIKYNRPMRNAACTTIAPTGSISIIADCSSGVEPIFSIVFERKALDGKEFVEFDSLVERLGSQQGWLTDPVREQLAQGVPPREITDIPADLADVLLTAHQITPEWHVRIQAAFQENIDNAVSKTVNLPADATAADVDKIYRLAYRLGCKGITVYRHNSRENQVLSFVHSSRKATRPSSTPRSRPRKTEGQTIKYRMGCGTLFVTVNMDDNGLCEVFANLGKAGGCPSQSEATSRIASTALRCGVSPTVLIEQLKGIRCLSTITRRKDDKDIDVLSCPDAIARALQDAVGQLPEEIEVHPEKRCPACNCPLRRDEGCNVCDNCGYRKCG